MAPLWTKHNDGQSCNDHSWLGLDSPASLTLHCHVKDVADVAVAVGCLALVLAVVGQLDAAEVEVVLVRRHLPAGFFEVAVFLVPCNCRSWSSGSDRTAIKDY